MKGLSVHSLPQFLPSGPLGSPVTSYSQLKRRSLSAGRLVWRWVRVRAFLVYFVFVLQTSSCLAAICSHPGFSYLHYDKSGIIISGQLSIDELI